MRKLCKDREDSRQWQERVQSSFSLTPLTYPRVRTSSVYLRNQKVNMDEAQYRWERVNGDQSRGLGTHQVTEVQDFGFYFENSATTTEHLVRGGIGFVL